MNMLMLHAAQKDATIGSASDFSPDRYPVSVTDRFIAFYCSIYIYMYIYMCVYIHMQT